jgi:hypothetical protein
VDFRHGVRSVEGSINGELSPGTYKDLMAAAVRRAYTAVTAISRSRSPSAARARPSPWRAPRAPGSPTASRPGRSVRLTAGTFNAANSNKNIRRPRRHGVNLTVMPLNGGALVAEGPIAASTWTPTGKVTYAPSTGHTDLSYAIEHWHADLSLSEVFSGCKINRMPIGVPPSGHVHHRLRLPRQGHRHRRRRVLHLADRRDHQRHLRPPPTASCSRRAAPIATLTGLDIVLDGNMSAAPVIGSTTYADIAEGRILVSGTMTGLFDARRCATTS